MVSAVVLTKNEEKNIRECLETLKWCDEIVVVDDYSDDKTVEIAKKHEAKIFKRRLNNDFASQRNFGLSKAKGDWVLFIDADERVTEVLASEIKNQKSKSKRDVDGFFVRRVDLMWGKELKHGETNVKLLRLAKKEVGKWRRRVHETWDIKGEVQTLANPLYHYPHKTLAEFLADIDRYSTIHAEENLKEGKRASLVKIILWPKLKFLQNYILKCGFLDGGAGFMSAMMMSLHSYLSWGKLWLLQR